MWQKAHTLVLQVVSETACFRDVPARSLRDQMTRAAVSIPANIAEGAGRGTDRDFRRFLTHALGSANELEYDLLLARDLGALSDAAHGRLASQVAEVRRMLSSLMRRLASGPRV